MQLRLTCHLLRRLLHSSSPKCHLVGPPDPVSHMRPIVYDDALLPASPPVLLLHPYSLTEFDLGSQNQIGDLEIQFKLQRQQLDALNHNFWYDSNTRFETAKEVILSSLPSWSAPIDRENALSEFYRQWYQQEAPHTAEYTQEWRKRNMSLILLGARLQCLQTIAAFKRPFFFKKNS